MTNHLSRVQYQQNRLHAYGNKGSFSSLRSEDHLQTPSVLSVKNSQLSGMDHNVSVTSPSCLSSQSKSQGMSPRNTYQNIIRNAKSHKNDPNNLNYVIENSLPRAGSISSYQPSSLLTSRTVYTPSHFKMSRSLKASKASLATYKSGRSTIQAEHHDRKVQREINSIKFGRARKLYWISVAFFILFLVVLFTGLLITCLRHVYMNIILSLDIGELTGPLLIACSFLFFGAAMKFYYDAHLVGCEERKRIKYKASSPSTVALTTITQRVMNEDEKLMSGKTSENALTRAPLGSRTTLLLP